MFEKRLVQNRKILKSVGHTLIVQVMNVHVKAMKVPDKPKGLLASHCMTKKKQCNKPNLLS